MLKKVLFYSRIGYKLLKKDVINKVDYKNEYNHVAETYNEWLSVMGKHTNKIIQTNYLRASDTMNILDFACGTGYITKSLLEKNLDCRITAVDYSEQMLEKLKALNCNKINIVNMDGIDFLKNTSESFDVIYFGWALSYFNHRELFKLFRKVLRPGGTLCIITNVQGTLSGIEKIFLKVMCNNSDKVKKPMDIKFNLPKGRLGLIKWLKEYDFHPLETDEGEVIMTFDSAADLLNWINKTGASAGTGSIFENYSEIRASIIEEIEKSKFINGKYIINHKFALGIFRRN